VVRRSFLVATLFALAVPIFAAAQFGSFWAPKTTYLEYDDRWVFTRLRYRSSSSWSHDYPRADRHLAYIVADISKARVRTDGSNVLDLGDPEIFRHPLVYMSEPGFWDMTDAEAENLRQYLLKGGLILFDDFETTQWNNMAAQMRRVLPEYQWIEIDVTHPVFHTFFDLKKIDYHHPMFPGMVPEYKALFDRNDPNGRMVALANHNNDLAEYWEWSDRGYFGVDPTNEAYRIGVNYVIYSLTH
jgi:hypothetical protein